MRAGDVVHPALQKVRVWFTRLLQQHTENQKIGGNADDNHDIIYEVIYKNEFSTSLGQPF